MKYRPSGWLGGSCRFPCCFCFLTSCTRVFSVQTINGSFLSIVSCYATAASLEKSCKLLHTRDYWRFPVDKQKRMWGRRRRWDSSLGRCGFNGMRPHVTCPMVLLLIRQPQEKENGNVCCFWNSEQGCPVLRLSFALVFPATLRSGFFFKPSRRSSRLIHSKLFSSLPSLSEIKFVASNEHLARYTYIYRTLCFPIFI